MLRGTGRTASVIHAAGSPAPGVSARPNALVVLVNTNRPTPAATASSSRVSVPVMFVSTNAPRPRVPTCGLCSVAACRTASAPRTHARTHSPSVTDPTTSVNGDASRPRPTISCPSAPRTPASASPRCPALPVTRILTSPPGVPSDGARGTRTPDLLGAIQALSQLSYSPGSGPSFLTHDPQKADCSRDAASLAGRPMPA